MKRLFFLFLLLLAPSIVLAQATHISTSGTLPTNCRVGDVYVKTGASAGLYRCSATDTWTLVLSTPVSLSTDASGTLQSAQMPVLTGDVTNSGLAMTIGANKVVDSMIFAVAWSKVTGTPTTFSGYGISDTFTNLLTAATATRQGNTAAIQTFAGSAPTTDDCAKFDANGNIATSGAACGGGSAITALTGDVTASGPGSSAATIANDAVTYAKLQNISATSRLVCRKTSGAGDAEECTASEALKFIGSTQGQVLYYDGSDWVALSPGTSGQVLETQGAGANPIWVTPSGIGLGDFSGPASSAANEIVEFSSTSGKAGQRSFAALSGPASTLKTYTLPNATSTILTDNAAVTVPQGGTGAATLTGVLKGNGTSAFTAATAGTDYSSPSSTDTLTNKTLDAEGSGNVITLPLTLTYVAAVCQNATASLGANSPVSGPAVAACVTGTNTQFGVADFAASSNLSIQGHFSLPSDWSGAIDWKAKWFSATTSGDVVWNVATICVADAETSDPAFNTASTVTDTTKGTTNQQNDTSISSVTITGCSAGEELYWKISRNAGTGSDTMSGTARLVSFTFIIRRAM